MAGHLGFEGERGVVELGRHVLLRFRARLLVLEVSPGDVDPARLAACQQVAAAGAYAASMSAFVQWLATHAASVWDRRSEVVTQLRAAATASARHRRTPAIVAELAWAWSVLLAFGVDIGALDSLAATERWEAAWRAVGAAAAAQARWQAASEPTARFLELLVGALASGRAHVAAPDGSTPTEPGAWGWRFEGSGEHAEWRPRGERVAWLDGGDLYLEPEAAYAAAQRLGRDSGDVLALTGHSLRRRLRDRKLLASVDEKRETLTVRRVLEGRRREVLHLRVDHLSAVGTDELPVKLNGAKPPPWSGAWSGGVAGGSYYPTSDDTGQAPEKTQESAAVVGLVGQNVCREREPGR